MIRRFGVWFGLLAIVAPLGVHSAAAQTPASQFTTEAVTLSTRGNVTVRYLAMRLKEPGQGRGAVLLLAGGNGALNLAADGSIGSPLRLNFLIRMREQFLRNGLAFVAAVDAPSDQANGMNGAFRLSAPHAEDIAKVIDDIKKRSGQPVWVIGTSAGTLSTANVGARLSNAPSRPAGIVLTSTMTQLGKAGHCGKSVFDATLRSVKLPVLVVAHQDDGCECTPAGKADALLAALTAASPKTKKIFAGGATPISGPCDARSQHGYLGIEDSVVAYIAEWIKTPR